MSLLEAHWLLRFSGLSQANVSIYKSSILSRADLKLGIDHEDLISLCHHLKLRNQSKIMQVLVSFLRQSCYFLTTNIRNTSNALGYVTTNENLEQGDKPT